MGCYPYLVHGALQQTVEVDAVVGRERRGDGGAKGSRSEGSDGEVELIRPNEDVEPQALGSLVGQGAAEDLLGAEVEIVEIVQ